MTSRQKKKGEGFKTVHVILSINSYIFRYKKKTKKVTAKLRELEFDEEKIQEAIAAVVTCYFFYLKFLFL